ncbi:TRAP transporter substrate-binding protein DctP [Gemmobacter sp. LW-1]|uniref:TRAP transporter substrate-binding protein DctP n=1 Tax=Gemmobacter sp. LW-1 TaxID=1529005 RepID=UPI0006C754B1|nr:TRAP transporter substrate-binding protein DctP [Gemmobacter sp. LW-1]
MTNFKAATAASLIVLGATAAQADVIKFSYPVAKDSTMGQTVNKFAELVEAKTGGAVTVKAFPSAQLGNEIQSISAAQGGIVEAAVTTTAGLAAMVPEFDMFNAPFTFDSYAQLDAVTRSAVGNDILAKLEPNNIVGLCYWDYGFRNITNNKRPVKTLEDVSGLRVRTIQNAVYIDSLQAMGMNPTPLPFPETFTALETGAIDGNEIANDVTRAGSFFEVQKYLTETRHFTTLSVMYVSKKLWDGLEPAEQTAVREACLETSEFNRQIINDGAQGTLDFLAEKGMQIDEIAPEELARFRTAVAPVVEKINARFDPAFVQAFQAEVEANKGN